MFSLKLCFLADYIGTSRFLFFLQFKWIFQDEEEEEEEEEKEGEEEEEKEGEEEEEEEEEEEITQSLIQKEHVAIIVPYRNPISSITVFINSTLSSIFTLIIISVIYLLSSSSIS